MLAEWANEWQTNFNIYKWLVMHIYPQQHATYMTNIACPLNSCRQRINSEISELLYPETPTYNGVSDAIVYSWLWSNATRSSQLGCFSRQLIIDPTFCVSRFSTALKAPGHRRPYLFTKGFKAKTNREKLENSHQRNRVHCPKPHLQQQKDNPSTIYISCTSTN